jgi:hypothetical protein
MLSSSSDTDRIRYLKCLRVQWTTELQHLEDIDLDRAFHLAEAIQDLSTVIRDLETPGPSQPPIGSTAAVHQTDPG